MEDSRKSSGETNASGAAFLNRAADRIKKRSLLHWLLRFYVMMVRVLRTIGENIIFRVSFLVALNILLYFVLENVSNYSKFSKLILIANMAILLVFFPSLHVTRESMREKNSSKSTHYVTTVFIVIFLFVLISMSLYFFFPYFSLSGTTNVSKFQKFVYLFMVIFLYTMIFLTYNNYMVKLYEKISRIPYLPSVTVWEAIYNAIRFSVLYVLVCLPIDGYRLMKDLLVGRYSIGKTSILVVLIVLVLFVFFYGRQLTRGVLRLNGSLTVLQRGEVYLNRQTNIGWYDEVIPMDPSDDNVFKEMIYKRGRVGIVKLGDVNLKGEEVEGGIVKGSVEYYIAGMIVGEVSVEETFDALQKYLKEDVYTKTREWLLKPFKEDENVIVDGDIDSTVRTTHRVVETFKNSDDGSDSNRGESADGSDSPEMKNDGPYDLLNMKNMVHRLSYSLSLWVYMSPITENYTSEKNILNFANKLALCLSRDGTTIYVDLDIKTDKVGIVKSGEVNERSVEIEADVDVPKRRGHGRIGKRVMAIDTFAHQKWNHIVVSTYSDGRINFFMNNVLVGTQDGIIFDVSSDASRYMIYLGEKGGVRGMARDVYYYRKPLTKTDVSLLYHRAPLFV